MSYDLEYHDGTLEIHVTEAAQTDILELVKASTPIVQWHAHQLGRCFNLNPDAWGYGEWFRTRVSRKNSFWRSYRVALPALYQAVPETTFEQRGIEILATLRVLFTILQIHKPRGSFMNQILAIDSLSGWKDSYAVTVSLAPQCSGWLKERVTTDDLATVGTAMSDAYQRLWPSLMSSTAAQTCAARISQAPNLHLNCPGMSAGLDPDMRPVQSGRGYQLLSHNIDGPLQLLTIIAGIAALNHQARLGGI